jgi:hypothetical protein
MGRAGTCRAAFFFAALSAKAVRTGCRNSATATRQTAFCSARGWAMHWIFRKIDSLAGAVIAAVGALACAQLPVFVQQYLQRLGGHVDEARQQLELLNGDAPLPGLDAAGRQALQTVLQGRLAELTHQLTALEGAAPVLRPLEFLGGFDSAIAAATFDRFVPALPLDTAGLVYAVSGLFVAWLVYEGFKLPVWAIWRVATTPDRPQPVARRMPKLH